MTLVAFSIPRLSDDKKTKKISIQKNFQIFKDKLLSLSLSLFIYTDMYIIAIKVERSLYVHNEDKIIR